jgi:hypothetical protein
MLCPLLVVQYMLCPLVKIIKIYLLRRPRLDILDYFVVLLLATSRSMVKSAEASILLLTDPHCLGQAGL